ncbi:MAG: ABC transporter permease [Chloroflexota bacterium]
MNIFWVLLRKEWLESWRTYRVLVLLVVLAAFGILSPVTARYMPQIIQLASTDQAELAALAEIIPEPHPFDSVVQLARNVTGSGLIVIIVLTMGIVSREKQTGTIVLLLSRPVHRAVFLVAKLTIMVAVTLIGLLVASLICYLYTGLLFSTWLSLPNMLIMTVLLLLYLLVPAGYTFLGSTVLKSQFLAAGLGFSVWGLLGILGYVGELGPYLPSALVDSSILMFQGEAFQSWGAVLVSLALVGLSVLLTIVVFRRQEL